MYFQETVISTSLSAFLLTYLNIRMAMESQVQSQISKSNAIAIGGNLAVTGDSGGAAASLLFKNQMSSVSSIEFMGSVGLRALIGVQTSRQLSIHSTASMGLAMSLRDGSINLSNSWTRQLSETTNGNIQLSLGPESSITVGWQKKEQKMSAAGEIKIGTGSFGATAHYTHRFSSKSHGRIAGRVGSTALEIEVGGGRRISDFSTVRMLYTIGIQGIFWKIELHCGGQKLIVPVEEAKAAAEKAQRLLQNVANRKRSRQLEIGGLVVTKALYGNRKVLRNKNVNEEVQDGLASQVIDVTLPLNFLVNEDGRLKLHEGVKKSGIMGSCDPCPGEPKQLFVEYTYGGCKYEVVVDDYEELLIPQELHRI